MIFLRTDDRNNVALTAIHSYSHTQSGKIRALDHSGESYLFDASEFESALFGAIVTAIPAAPGTFFLTPVSDLDGGPTTWDRDPVIAWGVKADGGTVAIGTDGADPDNRAILLPSGAVTAAFGNWQSYDEYVARAGE